VFVGVQETKIAVKRKKFGTSIEDIEDSMFDWEKDLIFG
jgi:hypothetical protein